MALPEVPEVLKMLSRLPPYFREKYARAENILDMTPKLELPRPRESVGGSMAQYVLFVRRLIRLNMVRIGGERPRLVNDILFLRKPNGPGPPTVMRWHTRGLPPNVSLLRLMTMQM